MKREGSSQKIKLEISPKWLTNNKNAYNKKPSVSNRYDSYYKSKSIYNYEDKENRYKGGGKIKSRGQKSESELPPSSKHTRANARYLERSKKINHAKPHDYGRKDK